MSLNAVKGPLQAPLSQWALVGVGALYLANPEKFVSTIQRSVLTMLAPQQAMFGALPSESKPTIIYQTMPAQAVQSKSLTMYLIQLTVGASCCWGTYMVLVNVLPDAAKAMLPVSTSVFNKAIKTLGRGILSVKETLVEQLLGLTQKQEELSEKQDDTFKEVLEIKDGVTDVRDDLGQVQESLDLCHVSLSESERRTTYIARGIRLLSRGVSSILPQDHDLAYELDQFNRDGASYQEARPRVQQQQRPVVVPLLTREKQQQLQQDNPQQQTPVRPAIGAIKVALEETDPENEVPLTPNNHSEGLDEVRLLLSGFKGAY